MAYYNSVVEQIEKNPSRDCPPGNDPTKLEQTYDGMILSLLHQLSNISKEKVKADGVPESERMEKLGKLLAEGMAEHAVRLGETINNDQAEMEKELQEQNKKITSDDIHEGFSSSVRRSPRLIIPPSAYQTFPIACQRQIRTCPYFSRKAQEETNNYRIRSH